MDSNGKPSPEKPYHGGTYPDYYSLPSGLFQGALLSYSKRIKNALKTNFLPSSSMFSPRMQSVPCNQKDHAP